MLDKRVGGRHGGGGGHTEALHHAFEQGGVVMNDGDGNEGW